MVTIPELQVMADTNLHVYANTVAIMLETALDPDTIHRALVQMDNEKQYTDEEWVTARTRSKFARYEAEKIAVELRALVGVEGVAAPSVEGAKP